MNDGWGDLDRISRLLAQGKSAREIIDEVEGRGVRSDVGSGSGSDVDGEMEKLAVDEGIGLARVRGGVKKRFMISISEDSWIGLKGVAEGMGLWWGGEGNISGLIQLIGEGKLKVVPRSDVS